MNCSCSFFLSSVFSDIPETRPFLCFCLAFLFHHQSEACSSDDNFQRMLAFELP